MKAALPRGLERGSYILTNITVAVRDVVVQPPAPIYDDEQQSYFIKW
jgi:hypothetical protein